MKGVKSYSWLYGEDSADQSSREEGPPKENIIEERSIRIFGDFLESKWRECDAHSTEI